MKDFPLVSVVMPAYNSERYIEQAIMSVLNQSYPNIELIIIDDCSTDNTKRKIAELLERDSRVALISNEVNKGVAKSRNIGIDAASGKWIALLDSDDKWEENKIWKQVESLEQSAANISYCSYYLDTYDENDCFVKRRVFKVTPSVSFESMLKVNSFSCSTVMIESELLKANKFENEYYHEDYALWMKLIKSGLSAIGLEEPLAVYRLHEGSRSSNKVHVIKERWIIYRKCLGLTFAKSVTALLGYVKAAIKKYR